ncbi:uncharacterized protein LOC100117513 isoform X2 [Nasonia vitripennis]|uniref:Uncharacterized protein n=1 Tax=Nasonia vitripennis TaxID=7425 RepID=A0A7M7M7J8_NASVI|nr:uncharacterized protein LOC100117513 isoform X2 [Nasonia vitripennis]
MAAFCTNLVLAVALSLAGFAAADLQNIQNANPLNIDLSDPSQTQLATNDADDPKFGGYRPLYPPYFLRESTNVGEQQPNDQTYYDKEYYTRGTQHDKRLDRNLRIVPQQQQQQQQVASATPTVTIVRPSSGFARAFPNFNHQVKSFASSSSSSLHVASSYSFSSVRFPNT